MTLDRSWLPLSVFQNISIIIAEKRTVEPKYDFKYIAFRVLFEIVKIQIRL